MADSADDCLSAEEYSRWLTPKQALRQLPHPLEIKSNAAALLKRASLGRVRVTAEVVVWTCADVTETIEYPILPPPIWGRTSLDWPDHFWRTGDVDVYYHDPRGVGRGTHNELSLTGVRFDPSGTERLARQLSDSVPSSEIESPPGQGYSDSAVPCRCQAFLPRHPKRVASGRRRLDPGESDTLLPGEQDQT